MNGSAERRLNRAESTIAGQPDPTQIGRWIDAAAEMLDAMDRGDHKTADRLAAEYVAAGAPPWGTLGALLDETETI